MNLAPPKSSPLWERFPFTQLKRVFTFSSNLFYLIFSVPFMSDLDCPVLPHGDDSSLAQWSFVLVPVGLAAALIFVHNWVTWRFAEAIGLDLLENCEVERLRETVCKAYENIGITTALVMTTVTGLLIDGHVIRPVFACIDPTLLLNARQTFVVSCVLCMNVSVLCVIFCLLNLSFLNSMSDHDTLDFILRNMRSFGETAIFMAESYILFGFASSIWISVSYGATHLFITFALFLFNTYRVARTWWKLGDYNPEYQRLELAMGQSTMRFGQIAANRREGCDSDDSKD